MWRHLIRVWLVVSLGAFFESTVFADDPSLTDIERVLLVLDSADSKTRSFEIRGSVCLNKCLEFTVLLAYRKPDEWLLKIHDASDETPILWLKNQRLLFYAPGDATLYLSDANSRFDLKLEKANDGENSLNLSLSFGVGKEPSRFVLDSRFLLQQVKTSQIKQLREQSYELLLESKTNKRATAILDLSRQPPLQSLVLLSEDGGKPFLAIKSIRWNADIADDLFGFPDMTVLSKATRTEDLKFDSPRELFAFLGRIAEAVLIRMGIEKPGLRQQLAAKPKLDWQTLQSSDRRISALLRRETILTETTKAQTDRDNQ